MLKITYHRPPLGLTNIPANEREKRVDPETKIQRWYCSSKVKEVVKVTYVDSKAPKVIQVADVTAPKDVRCYQYGVPRPALPGEVALIRGCSKYGDKGYQWDLPRCQRIDGTVDASWRQFDYDSEDFLFLRPDGLVQATNNGPSIFGDAYNYLKDNCAIASVAAGAASGGTAAAVTQAACMAAQGGPKALPDNVQQASMQPPVSPPGGTKKSALPWILGGVGVVAALGITAAVVVARRKK